VIRRIRKARQSVAEFYAKTAAAQPGEVWTTGYAGDDFRDNYFEAYTAGRVRILGEECPVLEYRGRKTLGEADLDPETQFPWSWLGRLLLTIDALKGCKRTLEPGDTAPEMLNGTTYRGDYLAALPNGAWVTVEYRDPHPVYSDLRNVVTGTTYDHDVRGDETGRDVGGDWVPFDQVTGVVVHSHVEVAS
jgi:hypothetical protein